MIKWIKALLRIARMYDAHRCNLQKELTALEKIVKDCTDINVDIDYRGDAQIIVMGRYKNADYIQTYRINHSPCLHELVAILRRMERYGKVNIVDGPQGAKAVIERSL